MIEPVTVKFYELADHPLLPQHLHHGEHQVGGGGSLGQLPGELKPHHFGNQHRDRLAQHGRLGFNTAHAPAQNREAVDHGGVAVGAHQGVGIGHSFTVFGLGPHHLG